VDGYQGVGAVGNTTTVVMATMTIQA